MPTLVTTAPAGSRRRLQSFGVIGPAAVLALPPLGSAPALPRKLLRNAASILPHARRLMGLWPFPIVSGGTATATATATSTGGTAVSQSLASSTHNSTAVANSTAKASGNSTAQSLSIVNATAAPGGAAIGAGDSSAIATGACQATVHL